MQFFVFNDILGSFCDVELLVAAWVRFVTGVFVSGFLLSIGQAPLRYLPAGRWAGPAAFPSGWEKLS